MSTSYGYILNGACSGGKFVVSSAGGAYDARDRGPNRKFALKLLAPQGRVVVIGSRDDVTISPRDLMTRRGSIHAFTLWGVTEAKEKEIHAALIAGMEDGTLRPAVGKELPLAEARRAHKDVLEPGAYGKIVLVP